MNIKQTVTSGGAAQLTSLELLTLTEFCEPLGITLSCARRWVLERKIATVKIGRLVRVPRSELARLVELGLRPALSTAKTARRGSK